MKRFTLMVLMFCYAAMDVVAQGVAHRDTIDYSSYSAIDYVALARELERASRPTLWQRMGDFIAGKHKDEADDNFKLNGSIGVGYTQETNAMFVGSVVAQYRLQDELPNSYTSLTGMFSINGSYRLRAIGNLNISARERIDYNLGGGEMPVRFWGLGYDVADYAQRSEYQRGGFDAQVSYVRNIVGGFSAGIGIDYTYIGVHDMEPLAKEYLSLAGVSEESVSVLGVNLMAEYDAKRYSESVVGGYYLKLEGSFYPELLSNQSANLWRVAVTANYYQRLWSGAVAAIDLYADMNATKTPWLMWSKIGGENRMRGYYYGRYIDRNMMTAQVELRQRIYGPISGVVWGGAGSIFSSYKQFDFDELLPNYGVGVRVFSGERTSLRIDYGFGRHSNGLVINVNEAF